VNRAEEYLGRAAEADARAEKTNDPMLKRQYRENADNWRDLARWAGHRPAEVDAGRRL
jgi:hypothetical protein